MFIRIKLLNLFCLNYASVYLMLNAVCETKLKSVDYKSIALPAELQGHSYNEVFNVKSQINQQLKDLVIKRYFSIFNFVACCVKILNN